MILQELARAVGRVSADSIFRIFTVINFTLFPLVVFQVLRFRWPHPSAHEASFHDSHRESGAFGAG